MKDKYIPDLIMSVIYKNHGNDSKNFLRRDDINYISSEEDAIHISLQELRDMLEDIFGEEK